ncbi:MAG: TIGR02147 family protein [Chitinispirillaceae bacterium]|nr:TIGR02147 family protein [Chitinispirillaceae bacterium]
MPNIFTYHDYRQYLGDYYTEKKAKCPAFSYQNFSQKAGFSSKSFIFNVIKGKKALSRASVVKLSLAMGLSKTESAYFENRFL